MATPLFTDTQWLRAERDIAALRLDFPEASDARLMRQLLKESCLKAGAVGGGSTAVGLIPGFGKLLGWAVNFAGDAALTASVQRDLLLRIFALFGKKPNADDAAHMSTWMATVGVGGVTVLEQVGGGFVKSLGKRILGKVLSRGLPVAEIVASSATHVVGTYLVARKAEAYCRGFDASTARTDEPDRRKLRNWTMLSVATVVDEEKPKTVKEALLGRAEN